MMDVGMSIKNLYSKYKLYKIAYLIGRFFPIKESTIVFESERDYWDNTWAFYKYLIEKKKNKYRYVWLTHVKNKYNNNEYTSFISYYSPKALFILARAKYIFYSHSMYNDIKFRPNQLCVYLTHGVALKGAKGESAHIDSRPFQYAITTGAFGVDTQEKFLLCPKEQILPLGFPRNDVLLHNIGSGKDNPLIKSNTYNKVLLWMPTFRASSNKMLDEAICDTDTGLPLMTTISDVNELDVNLNKHNFIILCKIHRLQADKELFHSSFSNIVFITDEDLIDSGLQLYEMIGKTDALITDYSSIYFDYMLLNKPIGFILDDLDNYKKSRGDFTCDNINDILAGEQIYNKDDFYKWLLSIKNNDDKTHNKRQSLLRYIHGATDDKSCERIANHFKL